MGSGDLNMKKSWHPQRAGNLAATAKAEAEAIAERKKMQQRLHEIEEERKKEEIQKTLEAAGGKRKLDRVEWMYTGGPNDQNGDSAENEAYLLGKRRIDRLLQDNEVKKLSKQAAIEQDPQAKTIADARDMATKIREDPLLAIKRKEQQAYEAMMNDPIKRRQLLASMGIEDTRGRSKHKEERRHKHRHHHRSRRHDNDDNQHSIRHGHRHHHRSRRDNNSGDQHSRSEEEERARKLAAMQEAATDMDEGRRRRLAAIEEAERKAQEEDDRARQRMGPCLKLS